MAERDRLKERLRIGRRIVVFIGPEGSGKTTHALRLAEESGKPYITTGDIIRDLAAYDHGPIGDECREMFATHSYLAGETLLRILVERFMQDDTSEGFVLDGGLRTLEETRDFQAMLDASGRALPLTVVHLQIPDEVSFERLVLGEGARKRKDDTHEGVAARLTKFHYQFEERMAVIERQPNWNRVEINATAGIECVYEQICEKLR